MSPRVMNLNADPVVFRSPKSPEQEPDYVDLKGLLRAVWQRKKIIIGAMLGGMIIAFLLTSQITPQYTALSKVMLDPRKSRMVTDTEVVSNLDLTDQVVNSEVAVLRSNLLIERVIRDVGMEKLAPIDPALATPSLMSRAKSTVKGLLGSEGPPPLSPEAQEQAHMESLVWAIRRATSVAREGESYVIGIWVETVSPELSMLLANSLANEYLADQLESRQGKAARASDWIGARVDQLRQDVEVAEQKVEEYRTQSLQAEGGSLATTQEQVTELNNQLALARTDRVAAEAKLNRVTQLMDTGGVDAVAEVVTSPLIEQLIAERAPLMRDDAVWAERFGPEHPERVRLKNQIDRFNDQLDKEVLRIVEQMRSDVEVARLREQTMRDQVAETEAKAAEMSQTTIGLRQLEREASAARTAYETLLSRLTVTQTQEQLQEPDAKLIERATIPGAPSAPRPKLMTIMGGMVGMLGGLAVVLYMALTSNAFRRPDELERETELPILATLPAGPWVSSAAAVNELRQNPNGAYAERIRYLRTTLLGSSKRAQAILVMSSLPGEGKTTTVMALAEMAARAGRKVLVLDGDLRHASVQRSFGLRMEHDFGDFIHDRCTLDQAVHSDARFSFDVISMKKPTPADADELQVSWMKPVIDGLKEVYDLILIDSPALLSVPDALVLGKVADSAIYLVKWNDTPKPAVRQGLGVLADQGIAVTGTVMTLVDVNNSPESYSWEYAEYA
ncbi:GumC family protein [Pseudooceanicola nanhaiensis]|uniref:GumC family protein n=1 Tax=Pseudooceanicola nanhaiensis TaxID=375761 RepID=UPI001CD260F2|nr:polysaccharide biosynthesis tyrosine autokinase [Pseudooceanicola nanhaiensis]MCA0921707.1 polysaccharide biosynthesis tyrosine autokinase [Pseudooceanicola nanhaiensis]